MSINEISRQRKRVEESLLKLPQTHKIVFTISSCEYLIPWVSAWLSIEKLTIDNVALTTLNELWSNLYKVEKVIEPNYQRNSKELKAFIDIIKGSSHTVFREQALYAAQAVSLALNDGILNPSERILDISSLIINTCQIYINHLTFPCDDFLSSQEQKRFDEWVFQAPLIRILLQEQEHVLTELKEKKKIENVYLTILRKRSQKFGIKPMRIGLVII